MTTKTTWRPEELATPELIEPMLDDVGFTPGEAGKVEREATLRTCLDLAKDGIRMDDLQIMAAAFADGFSQGSQFSSK